MKRRFYPTLTKAAESITQAELFMAPELSTLAALDATLLATTTLLEFNSPYLRPGVPAAPKAKFGIEDHLVESICTLANALRSNLSAYYATIQESCDDPEHKDPIMF